MILTLLQKEIREHLLTFRFAASFMTLFIIVLISVWVLGSDFNERMDTFNKLSESYQNESNSLYVPSHAEPTIGFPPSPLSIFAQGEQRRYGNFVKIKRWNVPSETTSDLSSNEILHSLPSFDLMTIFIVVISLFGLLLSYDAISGERENGTLKLICLSQLRKGAIYSTKFLGILIVLAIPFLLSFLISLLILLFAHGIHFTSAQYVSIGLMVITGLLYGGVFIALGMFISSIVRKSSTAFVLALLTWVTMVYIIPIISVSAVKSFFPSSPTEELAKYEEITDQELEAQITDYSNSVEREGTLAFTVMATLYWRKGGPRSIVFDAAPAGFIWLGKTIEYAEPLWQSRAEDIWKLKLAQEKEFDRQVYYSGILSFLSPSSHLQKVFTSLANTDFQNHDRFLENARRYRKLMLNNFRQKGYFGENVISFFSRWTRQDVMNDSEEKFNARVEEYQRKADDWFDMSTTANWDEIRPLEADIIPAFSSTSSRGALPGVLDELFIIFLMAALLFVAGIISFHKYDVR